MPTVLIIEDNVNIRTEVSVYFKRNGFNTISPVDFYQLENLAKEADVVFLDINLGQANGFDICRNIRKIFDIPILFVTGRDREEDELKALAYGGDDYIRNTGQALNNHGKNLLRNAAVRQQIHA